EGIPLSFPYSLLPTPCSLLVSESNPYVNRRTVRQVPEATEAARGAQEGTDQAGRSARGPQADEGPRYHSHPPALQVVRPAPRRLPQVWDLSHLLQEHGQRRPDSRGEKG